MQTGPQATHPTKPSLTIHSTHLIALLVALMGVINVISSSLPALRDRFATLEQFLPLEVVAGSRLATAFAGFALLMLSVNLWRRKQVAWLLTLLALAASALSHLLKGLDYEEAGIAVVLIMVLLAFRSRFHALSDFPSIRRGILVLAAALGFTLAYGAMGLFLLDQHFHQQFDLPAALKQTLFMFVEFSDPGPEPTTRFGRYFIDSIYLVAAATIGYSLIMLVRPVIIRRPAGHDERERARQIVERYGRSSIARFTLFDDKSCFFSPNGSVIAYVVKGGVALALGDPIGPEEDVGAAIAAFSDYCAHNDWRSCYYQVRPDYLAIYQANGYRALNIGQEGSVDLETFSLEGKANKEFRTVKNRMNRLGFTTELVEPPLSDDVLSELRAVSDAWLDMMHGSEMKFSLGWFDDDYIRNSAVMVVRDPDGHIIAFANLISEYRRNELTLDLMRRLGEVEPGTMDYLFLSIIEWARQKGFVSFSLGLSALAGVGETSEDPAIEKALHTIYENADRIYHFKGLHNFKSKFHPVWEPRYLIYRNVANLPAIATALARAHSGDNFIWAYLNK
ncbi:MAG: bifunctional lysylphosphatidylglycerol flippase/synthetase MprF [Candidatus Promineofilum sp.]|nr:bifunctional lysylphosphatidylglycerol flippase/synthetase MprF [Promineifilum sp.]